MTSALIDITDDGPDSLDAKVQEIIDLITEERAAAMPWRELIRAVLETKEAIDDPICPICEDEKAGCGCFSADGKLVPEAPG